MKQRPVMLTKVKRPLAEAFVVGVGGTVSVFDDGVRPEGAVGIRGGSLRVLCGDHDEPLVELLQAHVAVEKERLAELQRDIEVFERAIAELKEVEEQ